MPLKSPAQQQPQRKRRRLTRRVLIGSGAALGLCVAGVSVPAFMAIRGPAKQSNIGELAFETPLRIPPLATATEANGNGTRHFDLTMQTGTTQLYAGPATETWGVNGPFLAPTLRVRRGEQVAINLRNDLPQATSMHWHGMHLPARMDGGPHQMIAPGETWSPTWTVEQPASTCWYHPHPHGSTAEHVYRGVAGLLLVDDDESDAMSLPAQYGVDDIPLIIQDKRLTDHNAFDLDPGSFLDELTGRPSFGLLGDHILVNGTSGPVFTATTPVVRFRVLNGSNARFYNLGFTDDRPFRLLATDNGILGGDLPELTRIQLGPGERVELLVAFAPGDNVMLRSHEQNLGLDGITGRHIGAEDTFDILQCVAGDGLTGGGELPTSLRAADTVDEPAGATVRSFRFDGHSSINDEKMDMNRIDVVVPAGAQEIWEIRSDSQPHTFHIHGSTFHVLDVDGNQPPPHERGPKDTVLVSPDHPVRLLLQLPPYVDATAPYMFHCHLLRHEDNGMMGQFVVVEPGMEDATPRELEGGHASH